jgi:hypothetical protein
VGPAGILPAVSLENRKTQLSVCRVNADGIACRTPMFLLGVVSCDIPNLPRDRNRLKGIRGGESFQKLLNLCGFAIFDNHINLSLELAR